MELEGIIEKVRKEHQSRELDDFKRISWNNCVDYICDKLNLALTTNGVEE